MTELPERTEGEMERLQDSITVGNGEMFQLLCRVSSKKEGMTKCTRAMQLYHGCIVQTTTHQNGKLLVVAESSVFVPGVGITEDVDGGRKLIDINEAKV